MHAGEHDACVFCVNSKIRDGGWCFAFKSMPIGHCMKFTLIAPMAEIRKLMRLDEPYQK